MWEVAVIMGLALIILGPKQLAEAARALGKLYREIQKLTWELRDTINLDSISTPSQPDRLPSYGAEESSETVKKDRDLTPAPGEKAGPDFYADLLESAKNEEEEGRTEAEEPAESKEDGPAAKDESEENESKEGRES